MAYYELNYYPPALPRPFETRPEYLNALSRQFNIHRDYLYNHFGDYLPIMVFNLALDGHDWTEMYRMVHEYNIDINAPSRYEYPPIWYEVMSGSFDTVQQLILLGARLTIVNHETQQSLLDVACAKKFNRTKYLLMAYNVKLYKTMYPKIQAPLINVPPAATAVDKDTEK